MILTANEIRRAVQRELITIDPFDEGMLNPNSYNYRLGDEVIMLRSEADLRNAPAPVPIPPSGLILEPEHLYLGSTAEILGSDTYVTSLIGRSSMGRLGLFLQVSADLGHQGVAHRWTLELHACTPLRVRPGQVIGQVTFWRTDGDGLMYGGYYGRWDNPLPSKGLTQ
jgi:dCTP deaminase